MRLVAGAGVGVCEAHVRPPNGTLPFVRRTTLDRGWNTFREAGRAHIRQVWRVERRVPQLHDIAVRVPLLLLSSRASGSTADSVLMQQEQHR